MTMILNGTTGISDVDGSASTPAIRGTDTNTGIFFPAADTIAFAEGGAEAMRLDSNGNVGIGTSSPSSRLHVAGSFRQTGATVPFEWTVNAGAADFYKLNAVGFSDNLIVANSSGNVGIGTSSLGQKLVVAGATNTRVQVDGSSSGGIYFTQNGSDAGTISGTTSRMAFFAGGYGEAMRIDSSGNLLVGKTSSNAATYGFEARASGVPLVVTNTTSNACFFNRQSDDGAVVNFARGSGTVGSVSVTTTAAAYNTSSDYRLKQDIQPMTGALAKVAALKPCIYKWKADGSEGEGFIAHELAEVVPQCVTGEKDAVDADGNPVYQGIDTSFLVATLTSAIQEQQTIINELKTRIETLEQANGS